MYNQGYRPPQQQNWYAPPPQQPAPKGKKSPKKKPAPKKKTSLKWQLIKLLLVCMCGKHRAT